MSWYGAGMAYGAPLWEIFTENFRPPRNFGQRPKIFKNSKTTENDVVMLPMESECSNRPPEDPRKTGSHLSGLIH